jgi:hypothetical protein
MQALERRGVLTRERVMEQAANDRDLAEIKAAVDRIEHDVVVTTGLELEYVVKRDAEGNWWCGNGPGASFYPGEGMEAFIVDLADALSEWVSERLAGLHRLDEARTWPRCPAHGHSLDPAVVDEVAVWQCGQDPRIAVPVGRLAPPPAGA